MSSPWVVNDLTEQGECINVFHLYNSKTGDISTGDTMTKVISKTYSVLSIYMKNRYLTIQYNTNVRI